MESPSRGKVCCGCGHRVSYELRRHGERLGTVAFFDEEPASETYGERVGRCPGCAERLGVHALFGKGPPG
jgi:hypothetical protein